MLQRHPPVSATKKEDFKLMRAKSPLLLYYPWYGYLSLQAALTPSQTAL